jgi:protein-tyrosine phosphatase
MAEGYFNSLLDDKDEIEVSSAGTFAGDGESASPHSLRSMRKLGLDISNHRSTPLTKELLDSSDVIVAMTQSHKNHVGSLSPKSLARTRLMGELSKNKQDISDPFGGDADMYDSCLQSMIPALNALYEELRK